MKTKIAVIITFLFAKGFAQTAERVDYQELSWSPDGKKISFSALRDKNWDFYVMDADGANVKRLTDDPANDPYASWSRDGKKIAFASNRGGRLGIYVINADGTRQVKLTDESTDFGFPSWSPKGKLISYMSKLTGGTWQIYTMKADGTNRKRLTNNKANDYNPVWSPDGSMLAYESDRDGNDADEIYTIRFNRKNVTQITNNNNDQINDVFPIWISRDQISISAVKNRKVDIFVMKKDGSDRKLLIERASYGRWPPDRSRIAYISQGNNDIGPQVWVMNANGSNKQQLTK